MILSALSGAEIRHRLRGDGLLLRSGPFSFRIFSPIESVAEGLELLYADYPVGEPDEFADFTVKLERGARLHRWWRPQVRFSQDGVYPFEPLPEGHAFPQLEWAMNWCISTQAYQYLILHSAVIERGNFAAILPAPPGSGKSTLCAGLINRGWRLLSDELALISLDDKIITPLGRPVSLKNQSVDVIKQFEPSVVFNRVTHDTTKGSVTHMKVPQEHLRRIHEKVPARWVIFPKYVAGSAAVLSPRSQAQSMLELGNNAFNYPVLGLAGFEALAQVVDGCDCYDFRYSRLDDAVAVFDALAAKQGA